MIWWWKENHLPQLSYFIWTDMSHGGSNIAVTDVMTLNVCVHALHCELPFWLQCNLLCLWKLQGIATLTKFYIRAENEIQSTNQFEDLNVWECTACKSERFDLLLVGCAGVIEQCQTVSKLNNTQTKQCGSFFARACQLEAIALSTQSCNNSKLTVSLWIMAGQYRLQKANAKMNSARPTQLKSTCTFQLTGLREQLAH